METNNVFKKQCLKYKSEIKGKSIRILGKGYMITGAGEDNLLLRTLAPKGISIKPVDSKVWIEWNNLSTELINAVSEYFPQTENEYKEEKKDYVQMLLDIEKEEQNEETEA